MIYLKKDLPVNFTEVAAAQKRTLDLLWKPEKPYLYYQDIPVYMLRLDDRYDIRIGNVKYECSLAHGDEIQAVTEIRCATFKRFYKSYQRRIKNAKTEYDKAVLNSEFGKFVAQAHIGYLPE
jgi:hypothetical protein